MSASSSVGDFDLNLVKLRKPLEFADGTIQDTAYTGDGSETLAEVLAIGNNASNQDILGVGNLQVNTQIQLTPTGNSVNFSGEINQVALGLLYSGNQMQPTLITSNQGQSATPALILSDNTLGDGLYFFPNSTNNLNNPLVQTNDISIIASSVSQNLTIAPSSTTTCGVRMTDTTMVMGVGGTAVTPSQNITFNNPANTITATTTGGVAIQSSTIEPTPTLKIVDVPTGQATYHIPKANAGNYQPMTTANNQQIIAWGTAGVNTQTLEIIPHCSQSCGIRLQSSGTPYAMIGSGGGGADPSVRIEMNRTANLMELFYTNLQVATGALPNTAGASSGLYLPITINGVAYKIALQLA